MAEKKYLNEAGLSRVAEYVNEKLKTVSAMPASPNENDIVLYIGSNTATYTQGNLYRFNGTDWVIADGTVTLSWNDYQALSPEAQTNGTTYFIYDAAGGDEKEVVNGYLNPEDGKFYKESTYETEISSTEEVLYIDLNTEKIYRYSDTDSEYIMVGGSGDDVSAEIADIVNVYGAKNINSYPYAYTTREINGITFTDNGDGTVTANGTATADAQFNFHERLITGSSNLILPNGDYIISGCPSGGATTKYYINANMTKNGNPTVLGTDIGNGATITINGDDYSQDNVHLGFFIKIKSGQTVSDLLFKPMIRLASIKDDTYVPYAETNKQLTDRPRVYFGTEAEFDALPAFQKKKYQYLDTPEYSESIVYEELEITTAANQYVSPFTHYGGATVQSEGKIVSAYVVAPDTVSIPVVYTPSGSPKWVCLCAMKAATFTVRVGVLQEVSA